LNNVLLSRTTDNYYQGKHLQIYIYKRTRLDSRSNSPDESQGNAFVLRVHVCKSRDLEQTDRADVRPNGRYRDKRTTSGCLTVVSEITCRDGALFEGRGRALFPVGVQKVGGLEAGRFEIGKLDVFPGTSAGTGRRRAGDRRRGNRGLRGALRGRRRQRGRSSRAQATGARRLARVSHRRYLDKHDRIEHNMLIRYASYGFMSRVFKCVLRTFWNA